MANAEILLHEAWTVGTREEKPSKGSHISRETVSNILVRRPSFTKEARNYERHVGIFLKNKLRFFSFIFTKKLRL
jgi:hypothetical protein